MRNAPEQQQIDHWLSVAHERIQRAWSLRKEGFYERENISLQSVYAGVAARHASLGRARFLNGEPIGDVRNAFGDAARHLMKAFTMAYDETDPDYRGAQADLSCVIETEAIDAMNYALMSVDFGLAAEFACWYRDSPDGYMLGVDINRYTHALAFALREHFDEARSLLQTQIEEYAQKPPKSLPARNYHTLVTALFGIVERDEYRFNEGLLTQLQFYDRLARGEYKDTPREFICDHAVALANLALHRGLRVTVEYDTLPKGLLIQP